MRWISDEELLGRLDELACKERKLIAEVVAHLAELERRKLHLALSVAELVEEALALFVAQKKRQRFAQVDRPRPGSAKPAHNISAATRRDVFERDGARCTFVGIDGKRCESTHLVEFDHVQPRALGGKHDSENLRLLCRAHNQFLAEKVFGEDKLQRERASTALRRDALSALTNFGFKKSEARAAVEQVMTPELALEPLLRAALHELGPHP
jgi:5-methylcytosine-specific restriction endonuclease McrA